MKEANSEGNRAAGSAQRTAKAEAACAFLKAIANENRLLMLCLLARGERSVSEIESTLGLRQPTVSQQLARLRSDDLVRSRRNGKTIHYSLASEEVRRVMMALDELFQFCTPETRGRRQAGATGLEVPVSPRSSGRQ
jgi:DNA-binding transcriptional ArsR family regulator